MRIIPAMKTGLCITPRCPNHPEVFKPSAKRPFGTHGAIVRTVFCILLFAMPALLLAGKSTGTLLSPIRLSLSHDGLLAVSEYGQQKVLILDAQTRAVRSVISVDGGPLGVAWGDGVLFVGNDAKAQVEIYGASLSGGWNMVGTLGNDLQSVPGPSDIAFDIFSGRVFVLSRGLKAILVYSSEGNLLTTIGAVEDTTGCLHNPTALAVNGISGEVFVSDYGDPLFDESAGVKIYDFDGAYLGGVCGDSGQIGFEFSRPQGIAADDSGKIFVADSLLGQVLVFDRVTLVGVGVLGNYGTEAGYLRLPLDVEADELSGDIFVTNNRLGRIESFEQEETLQ